MEKLLFPAVHRKKMTRIILYYLNSSSLLESCHLVNEFQSCEPYPQISNDTIYQEDDVLCFD